MADSSSCLHCLPCNIIASKPAAAAPGAKPLLHVPTRSVQAAATKLPSLKLVSNCVGKVADHDKERLQSRQDSPELFPTQPLPPVSSVTTTNSDEVISQGLFRPTSHQLLFFQLFALIQGKLLGGHYHALRHAFRTFAPQGTGAVTKCALYRLLCNFVPGLTIKNFNFLLKR